MASESAFYYPIKIHRGAGSGSSVWAPFVNTLLPTQRAQDQAVVLAIDNGTLPQGLVLLEKEAWRWVLPMTVISEAIIEGSTIDIYLDVVIPIVIEAQNIVYKNGQLTTNHVLEGPSIFCVVTPSGAVPPPPPGPDFSLFTAATNVGGNRVVRIAIGGITYASADEILHANLVIGVTMEAGLAGTKVKVQSSGEMTEPSWNWIPGEPVFSGLNGLLTQTAPTVGYSLIIGVASTPQTIIIAVKQPIILF